MAKIDHVGTGSEAQGWVSGLTGLSIVNLAHDWTRCRWNRLHEAKRGGYLVHGSLPVGVDPSVTYGLSQP